jgi:Arginase/agmatinase/formimionoglutamate hydrolase, arginase family
MNAGETRVALGDWQESVRFGCSWQQFSRLEAHLCPIMPEQYRCVFTGSGDFHHLTLFLLRETARRSLFQEPFDLIICDNHPDNMRYPFGLHCGSWVSHAASIPFVRHVHVLGICSSDITFPHAWENRLTPFFRRKLTYWSVNRRARWLGLIGRRESCRTFPSADALIGAFLPVVDASPRAYLSLDKDVLSPAVVRTNWDQGIFTTAHLAALASPLREKLAGIDICGDVSEYAYANRFKYFLSRLDGQRTLKPEQVRSWQESHRTMNAQLLGLFGTI